MRHHAYLLLVLGAVAIAALASACGGGDEATATTTGSSTSTGPGGGGGGLPDPIDFAVPPTSCATTCPMTAKCDETTQPYDCPSLGAWDAIPHADECVKWDGKYPAVTQGKCTASAPTGDAAKYAGADPQDAKTLILPGGRRVRAAGAEWVFAQTDPEGGLTTGVLPVPGTSFVITVDSGDGPHVVRSIDTAKIGVSNPVLSLVEFDSPSALGSGIAFVPPGIAFVASQDGVVQRLDLDPMTGVLTRNDALSLKLPAPSNNMMKAWFTSGVAASADGKRLAVSAIFEHKLLIFDVDAASPTFGKQLGAVDLGQGETFGVAFDAHDPTGQFAYVSLWQGRAVAEVDLSDPTKPKVSRTFKTDKDPEGVAFLDARWMVVANDLGDTISLVDRVSASVTKVPITADGAHGYEPSTVSFDPTSGRLYATLAGLDAIGAWDVDLTKDPPLVTPAGRLPTAWWPGGVAALADGSLVVANMRGHGQGPTLMQYGIGDGEVLGRLRGSIQHVPAPTAADLTAGDAAVDASINVGALAGHPAVTCPAGADDFPVPATNTKGPSKQIQHVFLIVRENKTFDGLLGDLPGAEGEPKYTLRTDPKEMDQIWPNLRALAKTFAVSDNYYTAADLSIQGHIWTTYARSSDFDERTWPTAGDSRDIRGFADIGGIVDVGRPEEGSLFDWLGNNKVPYDILGEAVGSPDQLPMNHNPIDIHYPGGPIQSLGYSDVEKGCYVAGRMRVLCDLGNVVYATMPNDHTQGVHPDRPTPETFVAVNDEGTGIFIDALSHSPLWQSSLVFVTEDDPSQGGEHIDAHRTLLLVASPWVKHGYVSKTNVDVSSMYKIIAHVLGIPYLNVEVANAGLPLDLFTSTPDYTPYDHIARKWPLQCGSAATGAEARLASSFDLDDVDRDPDLDAQVMRWMRGQQLEVLPPALEAKVRAREEKKRPAESR